MSNSLAGQLEQIGLCAIPSQLDDFIARASKARWSAHQILERVVQTARRSLERRLEQANGRWAFFGRAAAEDDRFEGRLLVALGGALEAEALQIRQWDRPLAGRLYAAAEINAGRNWTVPLSPVDRRTTTEDLCCQECLCDLLHTAATHTTESKSVMRGKLCNIALVFNSLSIFENTNRWFHP